MTGPQEHAHERWALAEVDAHAIEHNVRVLRRACAPADIWAVVKADGYGHGAITAAVAALRAGATGLCVALLQEGIELRQAGVTAPILLLSEQPVSQVDALLAANLTPTVYTTGFVEALVARSTSPVAVHVNVDTGMQRVGVAHDELSPVIDLLLELGPDRVDVEGVYTHLACADEPTHPANTSQLAAFDRVIAQFEAAGLRAPMWHVANSAAGLALPAARRSLIRAGIAIYGISPGPGVDDLCSELRPAMRLTARVSHVKAVAAGSHVSYGWRHEFTEPTTVATVPIGYADGVPRRLGTLADRSGADVLIGGHRCPIVGVVTMDQLMVDVGAAEVEVGDEVVLFGRQGEEQILAEDWAERLGTIGYEIVCGIGVRVPRRVRPGVDPS